ncbi:MAG: SDR family oxidoreductase, partial [Bacteroidales bacterium]|nr:SDR family oxidoreductase [Bacteroidales bacterium]
IVTGASSGIGLATVRNFAEKGAKVVLAARNLEKIQAVAEELNQAGKNALAVQTDVSDENSCKSLIDGTIAEFGQIDVLVNNAGISMRAIFEDLDLSVLKKLMDTNFWGTVYCTKNALPHLLKTKGSVVGVTSIAGFVGLPARTGYSASKYAMKGFLDTLRIEALHQGLHVMLIAPGFTASNIRHTALTADGSQQGETPRDEEKMMTAEEVAEFLAKGIIKRKREIILTSQGKLTVTLNKFFPKMMDKIVFNHMSKEPDSPLKK